MFLLVLAATLLPAWVCPAQVFPELGSQRAGISAMPFLKNDLSPRSLGMGGASVALPGDAWSMAVNPAAGALNPHPVLGISSRTLIPGVSQSWLGFTLPGKNRSAWMVSANLLSSGPQKRRTEFQPAGDGSYYSSNSLKAGVGYSRALSKMFSFGVNVHFIHEQLARYRASAASVDLGFLYRTDWKDLSFAVGLQHFGVNTTLSGSDLPVMYNRENGVVTSSYGAPTLFSMGVSLVPFREGPHEILTAIQLNHPNDNAENIRIGVEYVFDSLLYVRTGFKINVPGESVSFSAGLRTRIGAFPLRIELATLPNRYLGWISSVGISAGFHKNRQL